MSKDSLSSLTSPLTARPLITEIGGVWVPAIHLSDAAGKETVIRYDTARFTNPEHAMRFARDEGERLQRHFDAP